MGKYLKILVAGLVLLLLIPMVIPAMMTGIVTVVIGGGEEEEGGSNAGSGGIYVSLLLSAEVERYREDVLAWVKKEGMEPYLELYLAVMQQESGGNGNDVFQASESKGLAPNTLSVEESIEQGVKYLSAMIKKAGCTSPEDLEHIKLALQGYNFGGAYIDFALKKDGRWTQKNTFAYAKKQSGGKRNTGSRAQVLGPWRYGDQYYTAHVLRYYRQDAADEPQTGNLQADGSPQAIPLNMRMGWLFPEGTPDSPAGMNQYLTQIRVPIYTKKKKKDTMILTVHKKLASEIKAVFEEMQKAKFPVDPSCTAGYTWRMMASNGSKVSYHSYGCVVDLNWTHNGASYTGWPYQPGKDKLAVTKKVVDIWKKHGFYWGGDWSEAYFDPMHFTYVNH